MSQRPEELPAATDDKPIKEITSVSNGETISNRRIFPSVIKANVLLYCVVTGGLACLLGIILNEYGILPPHVANIASGISAFLALIAGSWVVVEKLFPKDIWRKTWKLPVVLSLGTIGILIIAALYLASLTDPYVHQGKLVLNDPLNDNARGYNWSGLSQNSGGNACQFKEGAYHDSNSGPSPKAFFPCLARADNFNDFVFEVQMTINQGDCGGIVFRFNIRSIDLYYFAVCQDGGYGLYVYQNGKSKEIIDGNSASFINTGPKQTNLIAVVAHSSSISMYINHHLIASISDSTSSAGQIGVIAASFRSSETEIVYRNAKVWALS